MCLTAVAELQREGFAYALTQKIRIHVKKAFSTGEILGEGLDAKYFSKLAVSEGVWQVSLKKKTNNQLMFAHIHQAFGETVSSDCQLDCV